MSSTDTSKMDAWKAQKVADWEAGGKLKTKYPNKEDLEAWYVYLLYSELCISCLRALCTYRWCTYIHSVFIVNSCAPITPFKHILARGRVNQRM